MHKISVWNGIVEEISRTFFETLSESLAGFANESKVYRVFFFSFLEKQFL